MVYLNTKVGKRANKVWMMMLSALTLMACSGGSDLASEQAVNTADTALSEMRTYSVATVKEYKPFVLRDDNRELTGFDIELMNAIAEDQGFKVNYATVERAELLESVEQGQVDLAIAGISITPEREKTVNFSNPYYTTQKSVITSQDNPAMTDFSALDGHQVAVIAGGTSEKLVQQLVQSKDNITPVQTSFQIVEHVVRGDADYGFGDYPVMAYYANTMPENNLKVYRSTTLPTENYAIAFAKNREDELANRLYLGLSNLKASGKYQQIEQKWMGQ